MLKWERTETDDVWREKIGLLKKNSLFKKITRSFSRIPYKKFENFFAYSCILEHSNQYQYYPERKIKSSERTRVKNSSNSRWEDLADLWEGGCRDTFYLRSWLVYSLLLCAVSAENFYISWVKFINIILHKRQKAFYRQGHVGDILGI